MVVDQSNAGRLSFGTRLKHAYNAFRNKDPVLPVLEEGAMALPGSSMTTVSNISPRRFLLAGADKTIVTSIYQRLATDCSTVNVRHVRLDSNDKYKSDINDGLNRCLTLEANIDQTGRELIQDTVLTFLDGEGVAAVVPVDTTVNPMLSGGYDILTLRVGRVITWKPTLVQVELYNDQTGLKEQIWLPKSIVALVTNPFREVMNSPNSTLRRLTRKLAVLDAIDEQTGSGKLDLIVQLPYAVRTETRKADAERRRSELQEQLENSKYGVAYTDATEKIVQLNRPVENNLMSQVEYLTRMLYSQLGLTQEIMDGTATEQAMVNYYNRTINPLLNAICDEFKRKFLTKTAISQGQSIAYFRDPFSLTTSDRVADMVDKLTRNEVASSNEMRSVLGWKPAEDPRADELRNKNLNAGVQQLENPVYANSESKDIYEEGES